MLLKSLNPSQKQNYILYLKYNGIRFLLKSHGANFYTVFPIFNGFSENEIPIPIYYENVYNNVMDISSNFKVPKYGSFVNLSDEIQVYQDGTDKDNLASLILLAKYNENETDEEEDIRKRNETKINHVAKKSNISKMYMFYKK